MLALVLVLVLVLPAADDAACYGGSGCQHDSMEQRTAHGDCVVSVAIVPMPLHHGLLWELLKKGLGRHL